MGHEILTSQNEHEVTWFPSAPISETNTIKEHRSADAISVT
jgi:hypothetical protein